MNPSVYLDSLTQGRGEVQREAMGTCCLLELHRAVPQGSARVVFIVGQGANSVVSMPATDCYWYSEPVYRLRLPIPTRRAQTAGYR
jgi:hypothetical protein